MNTNNRSAFRWLLIAGYLGVIFVLLACTVFGGGTQTNADGPFRLEDGVIEVQDENGDWIPVAGDATFELVGELESLDPWTVAGTVFETNELTQTEDGLQVGDVVQVRGAVLEDETWLAYSIELAGEQTDPILILIGIVDSVDPWMVNGIELNVTDATIITGDSTPGMIVRVEILLLPDGTWEVLSIASLGDVTQTERCVTVIATVVSVDGNEIQLLGWPTPVTLEQADQTQADDENSNAEEGEENGDAGETDNMGFAPNQTVLAVICVSDDGQIVIVQVILLDGESDMEGDDTSGAGEKVLVCHKPDKKGGNTLSISSSAVPAHLGHGDTLGACP